MRGANMDKIYETYSADETYEIGKELGKLAKKGDLWALNGDLGVGKTVFTKGFAVGLGIDEHITSPTFTIVNEYDGILPFYHFDLYRLTSEEEMDDIGYEDYFFGDGVALVEWAENFPQLMPSDMGVITIEKDFSKGDDYRKIIMTIKE